MTPACPPLGGSGSGTEPRTARTAVRLRQGLAAFGALACGLATLYFARVAADEDGGTRTGMVALTVAAGLGTVLAAADFLVLGRRRRSRAARPRDAD